MALAGYETIVRDRGLKELLAFIEPNYQLPSTTHVSTLIRKQFHDGKAALSMTVIVMMRLYVQVLMIAMMSNFSTLYM